MRRVYYVALQYLATLVIASVTIRPPLKKYNSCTIGKQTGCLYFFLITGLMWSIADIGFFLANEVLEESVSFPIISAVSFLFALSFDLVQTCCPNRNLLSFIKFEKIHYDIATFLS